MIERALFGRLNVVILDYLAFHVGTVENAQDRLNSDRSTYGESSLVMSLLCVSAGGERLVDSVLT